MFSRLFITLSLCHSWGHILELFSFTFQKILEGKDKCHSASLEPMVSEKSKYSPGSLCFYLPLRSWSGSVKGGSRQRRGQAQLWGTPIYFLLPMGRILKDLDEFVCLQTAKEVLTCPTLSLSPEEGERC